MLHACTCIPRSRLPFARVLAASFLVHNPGARFTVLLIDDPDHAAADRSEPFEVVYLDEIIPDAPERHRLLMEQEWPGVAAAAAPRLLRALLATGSGPVCYLASTIYVCGCLDEVETLADQHGLVLAPTLTAPLPVDDFRPTEGELLAYGLYNRGFAAVGPKAATFLGWWADRLGCTDVVDPLLWASMAAAAFRPHILKSSGYNLSYWNADRRSLARGEDGVVTVERQPLRFADFSGYEPDQPWQLSKYAGSAPRVLLSEHPVLAELCEEYRNRLLGADAGAESQLDYRYSRLPDGMRIDNYMRRLYRRFRRPTSSSAEPDGLPPDSFVDHGGAQLVAWLNSPWPGRSWVSVSRYLYAIYDARVDLQAVYPDGSAHGLRGFVRWVRRHGVREERIPSVLARAGRVGVSPVRTPAKTERGVNVVGFFRAELGLGEGGRLAVAGLEAAEERCATVTWTSTWSRQDHPYRDDCDSAPYDINLLCVNSEHIQSVAYWLGPDFFRHRYTIGSWAWELEAFPRSLWPGFQHVDEVWANSEFTAAAIRRATRKPVLAMPPSVQLPDVPQGVTRSGFGLPEGYLFLFCFDYFSVMERKNPLGLIDAFRRAFVPSEGPVLVIKGINGDGRRADRERVRSAAAGRPDIVLLEDYFDRASTAALTALCDCYVSLHRAEGFGLTLVEAMALGKPVIGTGYSGNLTFMSSDNSFLVPYQLVAIPPHLEHYSVAARWAEPDVDAAAAILREVASDPEAARARGVRGRDDILERHSVEVRGQQMRQRLAEVRGKRRVRIPGIGRFSGP